MDKHMPEKFNFSKPEDQKKFNELSQDEKIKIVDEVYGEAEKINSAVDELYPKREKIDKYVLKDAEAYLEILKNHGESEKFELTDEQLKKKKKIIKRMMTNLDKGVFGAIKNSGIQLEEFTGILEDVVMSRAVHTLNFFYYAKESGLLGLFDKSERLLDWFENNLNDLNEGELRSCIKYLNLPESFLTSEKIQKQMMLWVKKEFDPSSGMLHPGVVFSHAEKSGLLEDPIAREEIKAEYYKALLDSYSRGCDYYCDYADRWPESQEYFEKLGITKDEVGEIAKKGFTRYLMQEKGDGIPYGYKKYLKFLGIEEYFFQGEEFVESVKKRIEEELRRGIIESVREAKFDFKKIEKEFWDSPEMIEAAKEGLIISLHPNWIERTWEIISMFKLPEDFFQTDATQQAAKKCATDLVEKGELAKTLRLINKFNINENFFQDKEVLSVASKGVESLISRDKFQSALELRDKINPEMEISQDIIDLYYPAGITLSELARLFHINQVGSRLVSSMRKLEKFSYSENIKPLLAAQGDSAFLYFEAIKKIKNFDNLSVEDIEYITYVGKRYGTQARNILENILGKVDFIAGEKNTIEEYISEIGIAQFEIYKEYKEAKETGDQLKVEQLKERVKGLQDKIYLGEMKDDDFEDEMYKSVSYYSFPPAMGLTQDQYNRLNSSRPDRRDDVPKALDSLQYSKIDIPTGKFVLEQGSELDLEDWALLSDVVKKVNAEIESGKESSIDTAKIGEKLVEIYKDKKQSTDEGKRELFENMYRYHVSQGGRLESGYDISIDGLMKYKEFIGDRIKNDLVRECLSQWRKQNPEEYESLKKETLNRLKQGENQSFAKIKNILEGIRKQQDEGKKQTAIVKLDDFLANFGLSYETVRDMDPKMLQVELGTIYFEYDGEIPRTSQRSEEYYNSSAFIGAYDELLARYDQDALVVRKISSDLVAGINRKMRKELDKFEFSNESGQAEQLKLEFVISKKREHGVAGYNMGVCVTPDKKLWDDPQFMNCIMFESKTKRAMGGMHFLIRENNLCLPGVNPSMDILSEVENEKLFDQMIAYAKKVKEALGLSRVLIPTNSGIHSNRQPIQEIIRKRNYGKFSLNSEAEFSYDPYKYSFRECFEV